MRRMLFGGALTAALVLVFAGAALAAGKAVKIGTPFENGQPSVAVDNAGDSFIAWANTKDLAGAPDLVQYCVVPVNAVACAHSGTLTPADSASHIDGVQALVEGNTFVLLADVYGASSTDTVNGSDYEPEQEWQSADGGATFASVNGGLSVTSGILSADTGPVGAVTVPGAGRARLRLGDRRRRSHIQCLPTEQSLPSAQCRRAPRASPRWSPTPIPTRSPTAGPASPPTPTA